MVSSAEVYECYICLEEYPIEEGVATCAAHFFCNDCIIAQFEMLASQQGFDTFPARCCNADTTIGVDRAHHLLSPEVLAAYRAKEAEFYTPLPMRVYCSSQECHKWLPATRFEEQQRYSVARCDCGTLTCVGCKGPWERRHRCGQDDTGRADWLPEYTSTCRIKKCPGCKGYIELREACNHMTCNYCAHEFCWVCLLPWDGVHNEDDEFGVPGCPSYGDPDYDGELYETNARGLNRDTGLNREGLDRLGSAPTPVDDGVEPGEEPWADLPDLVQGADAWDWEAHPEEPTRRSMSGLSHQSSIRRISPLSNRIVLTGGFFGTWGCGPVTSASRRLPRCLSIFTSSARSATLACVKHVANHRQRIDVAPMIEHASLDSMAIAKKNSYSNARSPSADILVSGRAAPDHGRT